MRYETVTVRHGEDMGPIDWSYDFRQHFSGYCCDDAGRDRICAEKVALLRKADEALKRGDRVRIETVGQFSHELYKVRMYDGWPFWKPTPYLLRSGPLGPEWDPFYDLTAVFDK